MPDILNFFASIEGFMVGVANLLPFGYAFGAGMVASVNPCGFLMLPAFGTYYLGAGDPSFERSPIYIRLLRALFLGATATVGFVLLFGIVGIVLSLQGRALISVFPWAGLLIGVALASLGAWLLITNNDIGIFAASRIQAPIGGSIGNVFLFGIAYGVSSLSCTLPIFLVVVGTALSSGGLLNGLTQFVSYGLGMGTMLILVTISVAVLRDALITRLRTLLPHVHRVGAVFLLGAGIYLIYYWVALGDIFAS